MQKLTHEINLSGAERKFERIVLVNDERLRRLHSCLRLQGDLYSLESDDPPNPPCNSRGGAELAEDWYEAF